MTAYTITRTIAPVHVCSSPRFAIGLVRKVIHPWGVHHQVREPEDDQNVQSYSRSPAHACAGMSLVGIRVAIPALVILGGNYCRRAIWKGGAPGRS
jgi:hypothetical protein